jgi:hypothetical protein
VQMAALVDELTKKAGITWRSDDTTTSVPNRIGSASPKSSVRR